MSAVSRVALALLALVAGAPLARVAAGPAPWRFTLGLVALTVLSALRPLDGLLVVCGLFPLASMIGVFAGVPWIGTQTALCLTLAFLAGWLLHAAARGGRIVAPGLAAPLLAFAALIVASAAVTAIAAGAQPGAALRSLATLLDTDYVQTPAPEDPAAAAVQALAGLAMFAAASGLAGRDSGHAILRMLVVGLTGAAALNVARFAQAMLSTGEPLAAAARYGRWLRINVHYADLNAAASAFALAFLAAIGLTAANRGLLRAAFAGCSVTLALALWIAGSRTAIAAVALAAAAALAVRALVRAPSKRASWAAAAALVVASTIVAVWMLARFPRVQANTDPSSALAIRVELFARAGRMVADAPGFGLGVGRFFAESVRYATPRTFGPDNAHNIFAQVAAELGLIGLAAFVWLLAAAMRPAVASLRRGAAPELFWTAAAVLAYVVSGMAGHPLIVFDAAVPFWIALGVIAGYGAAPQAEGRAQPILPRARLIAAAAVAALAISVPIRANQLVRWRHFDEVTDATWHSDGTVRYRDVGERDVIFVRPPTSAIVLPMKLAPEGSHDGQVLVALDGVPANGFAVSGRAWTRARIWLPRSDGYDDRKIELRLTGARADARLLVGRVILEK